MNPTRSNGEFPKGQSAGAVHGVVADNMLRTRARTPQESLGISNQGGLFVPVMVATAVAVALLAVLTVTPYLLSKLGTDTAKADQPPPSKAETPAASPPATTSPAENPTAKKPADTSAPPKKTLDKKDVPDLLGETGTKKASPKVNPLDKADDLLKDLK
jgi:hypothetical protein